MKLKTILLTAAAVLTARSSLADVKQVDLLLKSGVVDLTRDTLTLPLHHGHLVSGQNVFYVLTDASDATQASRLGLVYAPALGGAANVMSTRKATRDAQGELIFNRGVVNFSPERALTTGDAPNLFPPKAATPGSIGDANYSPYVLVDGVVYNAPIVAFNVEAKDISFCEGNVDHNIVHDKVVAICPSKNQVVLGLAHGFASGKEIVYVSLDANNPVAATMEGATYAPATADLGKSSVSLPLFAVVNGATGKANPNRQGFESALAGEGSPLNVLTGIPDLDTNEYTPLWELYLTQWTEAGLKNNARKVLTKASEFQKYFKMGYVSAFGGGALVSSGLLVNCPAVAILK